MKVVSWAKMRADLAAKYGAARADAAIAQLQKQISENPEKTGKTIAGRAISLDWKKAHKELSERIGILETTLILNKLKILIRDARKFERKYGAVAGCARASLAGVIVSSNGIDLSLYEKSLKQGTIVLWFVREDEFTGSDLARFQDLKGFYSPHQKITTNGLRLVWKSY